MTSPKAYYPVLEASKRVEEGVPLQSFLIIGAAGITCSLVTPSGWLTAADAGALAALREVQLLSERLDEQVWPGYAVHRQAFLAYDDDRLSIFVGGAKPREFEAFWHAGSRAYVRMGPLPQLADQHIPRVWLDKIAAVALPYSLLLTETTALPWRIFSPAFTAWFATNWPGFPEYERLLKKPYPTANRDNAAASELEMRILALALRAGNKAELLAGARQFLAVRAERRKVLPSMTVRFEDTAESVEGLPRYVAASYAAWAHDDPALRTLVKAPDSYQSWRQAEAGLRQALEYPLDSHALAQGRYALSGLAIARLLDRLDADDWQQRAQAGKPLSSLLGQLVGQPGPKQPVFLAQARQLGGWADLLLAIKDPAQRFPEAYRAWLRNPGHKFTCWLTPILPNELRMSYHEPPLEIDAHTLYAHDLTFFYYQQKRTVLETRGLPMAWQGASIAWPYQRVTFFLPSDAELQLNGKPLVWREGKWKITGELTMRSSRLRASFITGTLLVKGRQLELRP
ncbi:MAG: hypothetical protein HY692_02465 [Cyanobacteria bacterium NC_groundwater_1444_Ag_S-0.65um_54_12]|nr:hypothetical protein [Cyanobacteria bacterium NC_groundwater_1444_Ag_S-0.65um_54_12]